MGEHLANALHSHRQVAPAGSALRAHCAEGESILAAQTLTMSRAGEEPWWGYLAMVTHVNKTIYECDVKLGQPSATECAQLVYSQSSSELARTIQIGPGVVEFIHLDKYPAINLLVLTHCI